MKLCSYFGNPWIRLYTVTNNETTLVPIDMEETAVKLFEENLKTTVTRATISDSNLLGLYTIMNSKGIVLPNVANANEVALIKKTGLNVYVSSDTQNAHGNNTVVNDHGGIVSPYTDKHEKKKIEDFLGIELVEKRIAGYSAVGSACIATNKGFLAHYGTTEEDLLELKRIFKVSGSKGTVNLGTGFVSVGVIANIKGYVAGDKTTAFELGRVEESLGFLNE
ncbi:MAG: translation initiation factor IF-6 [Candidatus Micrarchaeota archaeon]|nr:translation initiation factor IF-6 [Candidatus Micrarchaeota archaeon]